MENTFEAKASVKSVGVTPRKVRLVLDMVRGKTLSDARAILKNVNKSSTPIVLKLINSAAANATNNLGLKEESLFVKEIYANENLKMKRFMPRAKGSASSIVKRTSQISVVLAQK